MALGAVWFVVSLWIECLLLARSCKWDVSVKLGGSLGLRGETSAKGFHDRDTESQTDCPEKESPHLDSQTLRSHRQRSQTNPGSVENRSTDGGRQTNDWSFAGARRWNVFAIDQRHFDRRNIFEMRPLIIRKSRVENLAILELYGFEQGAANGHRDCAFDLILQMGWIDDGAAVECFDDAQDLNLRRLLVCIFAGWFLNRYFGASCQVSIFLKTTSDTKAVTRRGFCPAPTERLRRGLQYGTHSFVPNVLQTKRQRIQAHRIRQFINVRLAGGVISRRCQSAIRTLTQRRARLVKANVGVGNVVLRLNPRAAGVVVVKLPRGNHAVRFDTALDI